MAPSTKSPSMQITGADRQSAYVAAIRTHSRRIKELYLYPGANYTPLAQFLATPKPQISGAVETSNKPFDFLVIQSQQPQSAVTQAVNDARQHVPTCTLPLPGSGSGQICFMRGLPTPDWLKVVGSHYRIDPEFFRRHLDFLQGRPYNDLPPLPSTSVNMIRIRISDVFIRQTALTAIELEDVRREGKQRTREFHKSLASIGAVGDTVIRRVTIHNRLAFTLEWNISMYVTGSNKKGWTSLVWVDVGKSLSRKSGPWTCLSPIRAAGVPEPQPDCLPIIQHRHKLALEEIQPIAQATPSGPSSGMFQSGSLLPFKYGKYLHKEAKNNDAMYALSDIFTFFANSENQFLNFIDTHIDDELDAASQQQRQENTVDNLRRTKALLDDHASRLAGTLTTLNNRSAANWPRSDAHAPIVAEKMSSLSTDFAHLLKRANFLSQRCASGIDVMGSTAQLEEARKAIQEAEQTRRLTLLAFFYLPLTFTTSIFGMNFKELGQGNQSIWLAFVTGAAVLAMSSVAYGWREMPWNEKKRRERLEKRQLEDKQEV